MRRKGFTLLELVLVIAVIAILAAIVAPRFTSQVPKAKISASKAQLTNLRSAVELYRTEDQNGKYPATLYDLMTYPKQYIRRIPAEPLSGSTAISSTGDGNGGWYYYAATGDVRVNVRDYDDPEHPGQKIYPLTQW